MKWFAIVNPTAGRRAVNLDELKAASSTHGLDVEFVATPSAESVKGVVEEAIARGYTQFIAVGGDGTAHMVVNALMPHHGSTRFSLAIIASGSGSDLVRTFGHSKNIDEAFARLVEPDRYAFDVGSVAFGTRQAYFVNAANVGVAAASVTVAQRLPRLLGGLRYIIGFWLALARYKAADMRVEVDDHVFTGKAINVVVANGQFFGGGMNIAPRASTSDGLFDVQVFSGPKRQAFTVMPRVLIGSHLSHKAVRRYVGTRIGLSGEGGLKIEADGELLGDGPATINVIPSAIDLVI